MNQNQHNQPEAQIPFIPDYLVKEGRDNKLLDWSWVEERLKNSRHYWIATTNSIGNPHLMPIWGIWFNGNFFFSTGRRSRKLLNIIKNPYCVITTEDPEEPVIMEGVCEKISDLELMEKVLKVYREKYNIPIKPSKHGITDDQGKSAPVFRVKPQKIIAWQEFPNSATKWIFNTKT
ncbi:MAG: pyridoxamine 5'-phosphate oxidase family protein [Candidatus Hodarchaeales archaeon]